ncbi:hypothetical protein Pmani_036427 [Petrolisthes manimaculis]|uniref:Uncharacterized protein n=1 Tax=Petrolisthes manimaculis TaxID=1843537 RepID=A0AAE1TPE1_9EUCA|nr:hypothetical protein Pmani_036427 [Petrolisthes manimaculis]
MVNNLIIASTDTSTGCRSRPALDEGRILLPPWMKTTVISKIQILTFNKTQMTRKRKAMKNLVIVRNTNNVFHGDNSNLRITPGTTTTITTSTTTHSTTHPTTTTTTTTTTHSRPFRSSNSSGVYGLHQGVSRCQGVGAGLWQGGIVSGGALSFKDLLDDQPIPSSFLHHPPSVSSSILPSAPSFQLSTDPSSLRPSSVFLHVHPTHHSSTLVGNRTLDHHSPGHPEATTHPSSRCNSLVPFPQDSSQSLPFLEPLVQDTSASEIQQPIDVESEHTEQTLDYLQLYPRQTYASKVQQPMVLGTSPSSLVPLAFTTIPQSQFPSALSGLHHPKPEPEVIKNCQSERGNWSFLDLVNRKEDEDEDKTKNKEGKTKEDVKGKDKEVFQYPFDKLASVHKNTLRSKNAESASSRIQLQDLPKLTALYPDLPKLTPICPSLKLPQKSSQQGNPESRSVSPKSSQVTLNSSPNIPKNWLRDYTKNKVYQQQSQQQHQLDPISSLIAATPTNTSTTTTLRDILDYYNTNFLTQPRDLLCPKIKEGTTPPPPEEGNSDRTSLEYITSQTGWYQDNWSAMVYYANMQYLNQCSSVHGVALVR